jgi:hypothetical protein
VSETDGGSASEYSLPGVPSPFGGLPMLPEVLTFGIVGSSLSGALEGLPPLWKSLEGMANHLHHIL